MSLQPTENRPKISFTELLKASWNCYQRTFVVNATASVIIGIIIMGLYSLLFPLITGMSVEAFVQLFTSDSKGFEKLVTSNRFYINFSIFSLLLDCILVPLSAGFYSSFDAVSQGKKTTLGSIFSYYNSPYTARLLGYVLLFKFVKESMYWLLTYAGLPSVHLSIVLILTLFFTFVVPLIIFRNQSVTKAMSKSSARASLFLFLIFAALGIGILGASLGLILFGIGVVLTLPFFYAVNYVLYLMLYKD